MDLLNELVFILSKNDSLHGITSKLPARGSSKSRMLYDAIIQEKVATDAEAAQLVYGTSSKDKKYLMLKRSLVNKLSQAIYEMSHAENETENYIDIAFECRQKLSIAERLLKQNVFHNAEKIIKKTLDTAIQYQLNEVELDGRKLLRMIYSLNGNVKKLEESTQIIDRLYQEITQQTQAEGFVQMLKAKLLYSIARTVDIETYAENALEKLESWQLENKNIFLEKYRHILLIYKLRMSTTPDIHAEAAENLIQFLNENTSLQTRTSQVLAHTEATRAELAMGNFTRAKEHIDQALELSDYRSFEKFELQTLHFEYFLKQQKYEDAGKLILEVLQAPQFEFVYAQDQAAWHIRQAYLYYALLNEGKTELIDQYTPSFAKNFSYNDFSQKAKAVQKDKQGYNISFLLISLLFVAEKGVNTIDYEGASLKIYYHRHLKEMRDVRTQYFFKWCYQLATRNFQHADKCTESYILDQLKEIEGINSGSCELIPYETLAHWMVSRYCTSMPKRN